jgi:hypothetical protein
MQPCKRDGDKHIPVGQKVKLYPAAIEPDIWIKVRAALESRRSGLRGRRGKDVANLFTHHLFCKSCGGRLRVDTGGGIWKARRRRSLLCAAMPKARPATIMHATICGIMSHVSCICWQPISRL